MSHHEADCGPRQRLRLFSSPLANETVPNADDHASKEGSFKSRSERTLTGEEEEGIPRLKRYVEPTLLELFFDLFFAANYEVFGDTQRVTNHNKFKAYIGYFCLLWLTWFLVTIYDVRFTTDSMFARFSKGLHFGVLVGFAVVSPKFNPSEQHSDTMTTMSFILMFSRLILCAEYFGTFMQLRKYPRTRKAILCQIALHFVAAMIYLGISFTFHDNIRTRSYMTWYFISAAEAILSLIFAWYFSILNLEKTHLMKRLTLLTIMFMGDGLVQIAKQVVVIVKHPDAWDPPTIGTITAAVATVYFVFLIYFDWLRSNYYLSKIRQLIWTAIHLPFHLALVLFMQSFTQYLIWTKIVTQLYRAFDISNPLEDDEGLVLTNTTTTPLVVASLNSSITAFFKDYPPKIDSTKETITDSLKNISSTIPDNFWQQLSYVVTDEDYDKFTDIGNNAQYVESVLYQIQILLPTLMNALFAGFGIDIASEENTSQIKKSDVRDGFFQLQVQSKTWDRYALEFVSGYIASGCTVLFMALLTIVVRRTPWKTWPIVRLCIIIFLAVATACTACLWFATNPPKNDPNGQDPRGAFLESTWVMPTLTLVWTVILIITHINGNDVRHRCHQGKRAWARVKDLTRRKKQPIKA